MAIRAVIFDRDGVLTEFDIDKAEELLRPLLKMSMIQLAQRWWMWNETIGVPRSEIEETDLLRGFWTSICDLEGAGDEVRQALFDFDYTVTVRPFPDTKPALKLCKELGLKVGVLSNFTLATLDQSLVTSGLAEWMDYVAAAPVIGYSKPQPESYLHVATELGVLPEECVFLDDEPQAVEGALAVGMKAYWVDRRMLRHDLAHKKICDFSILSSLFQEEGVITAVS
jgi:FMN phosphatase YigB (HAD superfamily)